MSSKKITYGKEDLKKAFQLHYAASFPIRSKLMFVLGVLLLVIGIILLIANLSVLPYLKYVFLLLGAFYLIFYFYRKNKILEGALKQSWLEGEHTIDVSSKKISLQGPKGIASNKWSEILAVEADASTWLFYFNANQFYIVPKRLYNQEESKAIQALADAVKPL